jgi:hypothetical protein
LNYITADVGETKIPSLITIRKSGMIHAQTMQHRSLKIMHVNRVFGNMKAQFISLTSSRMLKKGF